MELVDCSGFDGRRKAHDVGNQLGVLLGNLCLLDKDESLSPSAKERLTSVQEQMANLKELYSEWQKTLRDNSCKEKNEFIYWCLLKKLTKRIHDAVALIYVIEEETAGVDGLFLTCMETSKRIKEIIDEEERFVSINLPDYLEQVIRVQNEMRQQTRNGKEIKPIPIKLSRDPSGKSECLLLPITTLEEILRNIFINAQRHSCATEIIVSLKEDEEGIEIITEDNGIGFKNAGVKRTAIIEAGQEGDLPESSGIGIPSIQRLCKKYRWRYTIEERNNGRNGTVNIVRIPFDTLSVFHTRGKQDDPPPSSTHPKTPAGRQKRNGRQPTQAKKAA